ncbi:MAG: EAL domain-containing protein [Acidobacteriota bacterium]
MTQHPLLSEQLEAALGGEAPEELQRLISEVGATYLRYEQDRANLEEDLERARELVARVVHRRPRSVFCVDADGVVAAAVGAPGEELGGSLGTPLAAWNEVLGAALAGEVGSEETVQVTRFSNGSAVVLDASGSGRRDELLRAALDSTADGLLLLDTEGRVSYCNQTFTEYWEASGSRDTHLATVSQQLARPEKLERVRRHFEQPRNADQVEQVELETCDGRFVELYVKPHTLDREVVGSVWSFRDVTQRKKSKDALTYFAYHDQLTSLPNRRMFLERLEQAIAHSRRIRTKLLVVFVDLDRFKQINDSLGHSVGDDYLTEVAKRLMSRTRTEDTVARLAGDEFALLINNVNSERAIYVVAEGILDVLREPFELEGHRLAINASIGLALFPEDAEDAEDLLARADGAMYDAKARGGNRYRLYQPDMHRQSLERLRIENDLRAAIESRKLLLHYQPQVSLANGAMTGVEALVRWPGTHGIRYPGEFLDIAEESGLIMPLGNLVLHEASRQSSRLASDIRGRIAVNVSARQLSDPSFVQNVTRTLAEYDVEPKRLEIELTESAIMEDPTGAAKMFGELKELGVQIAIDDFGIGYSSFSHLKDLPIDKLKIDRSFVQTCDSDRSNQAILRSLVAMAHHLDLEVVAEGVETEAQADFLRSCECDQAQGFYFGYPVPIEELIAPANDRG